MKILCRLLSAAAMVALLSSFAWADDEKIEADKLPQKVKDAIKVKFPGATITSALKTMENNEVVYDIEMTKDGKHHEMDCKEDGTIINFENEVAVKDLPKAVADAIKAKYPDSKIKLALEVIGVKDKKEALEEYEIIVDTKDKKDLELTVSPDGKKIEEAK